METEELLEIVEIHLEVRKTVNAERQWRHRLTFHNVFYHHGVRKTVNAERQWRL